ncbi:MAG TPA: hypothetical protein VFK05_26175, partial [Polyangiaceae bacterium]|nr:hypothetical protein [Polyangiaceae bacterium]
MVIVFAASCEKGPEASPAQPPPAPSPPSAPPAPVAAAPAAPPSSTASAPVATPAPSAYPMCGGQKLATAPTTRSGAVSAQLAPAFLDEMSSCRAEDAAPADVIA